MELSYLPCISVVNDRMILGRTLSEVVQANSGAKSGITFEKFE